MPTTTRSQRRRQPVRSPQPSRRPSAQPARVVEAPDYTRDYADVRRDLTLIAIISVVLFAGMVALSFVL